MTAPTQADTSARTLARRRWDRPAGAERRVAAIAKRIATALETMPAGSARDKLTRALAALNGGAA